MPAEQSALDAHDVLHDRGPQTYGAHDVVVGALQVPVPLQVRGLVKVVPVQVGAAHWVAAAYRRQPPAPLQKPSVLHESAPTSVHWLNGSWPADIGRQAPSDPCSAHDEQMPLHALPQQTPCSQKPDMQSLAAMHDAPVGFLPQLPFTHRFGARHSAWVEQLE